MPQSLAVWVLLASLGLSRPDAGASLSRPDPGGNWTTVDFTTATCGYLPMASLTFSLPPGYVVRNPNHGGQTGCFWGREEDLNRAFASDRQVSFANLEHGIFQTRSTPNMSYDRARRRFDGEAELKEVLKEAGIARVEVVRRSFARHAGLVVTGRRTDGLELYMLYLAGDDEDDEVLLINYRPATPPTPDDSANWKRFLDLIR